VFGIGMTELLIVLVVALLVLGPRKLPEMARNLGRGMAEFRRASDELRNTLNESVREEPPPPPSDPRATPPPTEPEETDEPEPGPHG
jgi:Tat protein translocase TatB subunit